MARTGTSPARKLMVDEIARLRKSEGISQQEAHHLRHQIRNSGKTVDDYLAAKSSLTRQSAATLEVGSIGKHGSAVELIQAAQALCVLAGSKDRALKAIEVYAELQSA